MDDHFANDNIKVDLHIHSYASYYKDGKIVENSTKEKTDILISALERNHINMFAITDHNRFDYELYIKLKGEIHKSSIIQNILPGIEFDVQLEEDYPKCHIITLFDDSDSQSLKSISQKILQFKELSKNESYTIEEFEKLLKIIGLRVILIVHQKQSLDNKTGKTDSLSAACEDPSYFIKTGYIDSLEYGSSRSEGILKDSLRSLNISFPLITGSDCHDWNSYPYRDKESKKINRNFSSFKCLPTFKGLLMAISSFNSRANRNKNTNTHYIKSITLDGQNYPLANGINAIIGDNGAGKTLLLNALCNGNHKYYDSIVKANKLGFEYNSTSFQREFINYISQGEINAKVRNGNLFDKNSDYYDEIITKTIFSENIFQFFENVHKYVTSKIKIREEKDNLSNLTIKVIPVKKKFYLPTINSAIDLEEIDSDKQRRNSLKIQLDSLEKEFTTNRQYYEKLSLADQFINILDNLSKIYHVVNNCFLDKERRNKARSIVSRILNDYNTSLQSRRTSEESMNNELLIRYNRFKKSIIDYIRLEQNEEEFPEFPKEIQGFTTKQKNDYIFTKTTKYNKINLKEEFYKYCFNSEYNTEEKIKLINTSDEYRKALKGCTSLKDIDKYKSSKIQGFVDEWSKEETFISEVSSHTSIGNTPGEISLVYYKFLIQEKESDFCVLAIDQPEDDINPKRIKDFLLDFLGSIRDKKQVLIVTHNPLLVVNLDVDNVIYLNKINNKITIKYGALEYNKDYNILNLIKDNLDGGYKAIEGRLKKYDRDDD